MRNTVKNTVCIIMIFTIFISLAACGSKTNFDSLWENALYKEDTELGLGEKSIFVKVTAREKSVTFHINTDKDTLGEAMLSHKLISGEQGSYGLYVKAVNGVVADYDVNKCYWTFEKNGEYVPTGVDGTKISDGDSFEFIFVEGN